MGRLFVGLSLLSLIVACKKYNGEISNLNGNKIAVLGHAGMGYGHAYPTNSMESLMAAISGDADGTELDVQMTKDGHFVAFHDTDLEVNTNFKGKINDYSLQELETCVYATNPNLRYSIVALDDFFDHSATKEKHFSFDIKTLFSEYSKEKVVEFAQLFAVFLENQQLIDRVTVESYDMDFLLELQAILPNVELYYYPGTTFDYGMEQILAHQLDGLTISFESITKEQVAYAHSLGIKIITWGMKNKKENQAAVALNPDVIETDHLNYLTKYLK